MEDFVSRINEYYEREKKVIDSLARDEINAAMNALLDAYDREATVYVFGNGGSSATASHMVCDFNKGTCEHLDKKFRFVCLNDNIPWMMAISNDSDFENIFLNQLIGHVTPNDLVLAISGSGNSKNVIKAVDYAKGLGCKVIGMTGYKGGLLRQKSDYYLHAPIEDMQIAEDIHMTFDHMIMQIFWKFLENRK